MKRLYVDFKEERNNPNEQLIWIFDYQKKRGIPVSPIVYSQIFGKRVFETDEGEYLAIIFALEQLEYKNEDLEIFTDNQSVIDVLHSKGRVRSKAKPYLRYINELRRGRNVCFSYIAREYNPAGFKAEGHPCDKKLRDIEREVEKEVKRKEHRVRTL